MVKTNNRKKRLCVDGDVSEGGCVHRGGSPSPLALSLLAAK